MTISREIDKLAHAAGAHVNDQCPQNEIVSFCWKTEGALQIETASGEVFNTAMSANIFLAFQSSHSKLGHLFSKLEMLTPGGVRRDVTYVRRRVQTDDTHFDVVFVEAGR